MFRRVLQILGVLGALLVGCVLLSEIKLLEVRRRFVCFDPFERATVSIPSLEKRIVKQNLLPGSVVDAEVSWSQGNKTYLYLRLLRDGKVIWDFWGTNSLFSGPRVWFQAAGETENREILTYQPAIYPPDTPCGNVVSGYRIWRFDGQVYRDSPLPLCPLSLWLRSPIPLQD